MSVHCRYFCHHSCLTSNGKKVVSSTNEPQVKRQLSAWSAPTPALFASRCLSCAPLRHGDIGTWVVAAVPFHKQTFYSRAAVLRNCNKQALCSSCCYLGSLRTSRQILITQRKMWICWPLVFSQHTADSETILKLMTKTTVLYNGSYHLNCLMWPVS